MKEITITMDMNTGDMIFVDSIEARVFKNLGLCETKRASHVEPAKFWLRLAFTLLRTLFSDTSKVAAWTRTWNTRWRVNTAPVGGPILRWSDVASQIGDGLICVDDVATWGNRQEAIEAEVKFLNQFL
jgi:hypothetical protein